MTIQQPELKETIKSLFRSAIKIEPELLKSFVTYWSLRKLAPLIPSSSFDSIKRSNVNLWLNLVRVNHRFRVKYGESVADELIRIINENRGFIFFVP